jgi:pilus assembly protein CpaF
MQLLIENTRTAETRVQELVNRPYRIGRADDCDIKLRSPFVSHYHALIEYARPTFSIQLSGTSGLYVNAVEVKKGERIPLSRGDRIYVGDFVLSVASESRKADAETRNLDLAKRFVEIEVAVHDQLLERLDLRKTSAYSIESEEYVRLVHRHLTALLNDFKADLEAEAEDYIIRETLKMDLMDWVTFQGAKRRIAFNLPDSDEWSGENEDAAEKLRSRLAADLNLSVDPGKLKESVARLENNFDRVIERHWLSIAPGLKRHLLKRRIRKDIHDIIFGLGPLQDLINAPNISEIMVVSRTQIYVEKNGMIEESGRAFVSDDVSLSIIERIVSPLGRRIDRSQPLVDARLSDGSRVNAIIPPLALKGPCITIRKFSREPYTIDDLLEKGTLNARAANFLKGCVRGKKNIIISGGTGSGKTTLLNVLSGFISPQDRIVTIEDSAELQLAQRHVVQLETKPKNIEGGGEFTIRDLVKNALRMRPDRIIVGECRGGEALDMLQAMNTGHSGSMTTAHANSPEDMLLRLETMVLMAMNIPVSAIRSQIASAIDVVVQQSRLGGARRVTQITEIVGMDEQDGRIIQEDIFVYRGDPAKPESAELAYTGYIPTFLDTLIDRGCLTLEEIF